MNCRSSPGAQIGFQWRAALFPGTLCCYHSLVSPIILLDSLIKGQHHILQDITLAKFLNASSCSFATLFSPEAEGQQRRRGPPSSGGGRFDGGGGGPPGPRSIRDLGDGGAHGSTYLLLPACLKSDFGLILPDDFVKSNAACHSL